MARDYKLTWEANGHGRWKKEYKKQTFRVAVSDLPIPESSWTKEKSYPAALKWWEQTKSKLILAEAAEHPLAEDIARIDIAIDYAKRNAEPELAELEAHRQKMLSRSWEDSVDDLRKIGYDFSEVRKHKLANDNGGNRIIGTIVAEFLKTMFAEVAANLRSKGDADNHQMALEHFTNHFGKATDINSITSASWEQFYYSLLTSEFSKAYRKRIFCYSRKLLAWAFEMELLEKPIRNLNSKKHRFGRDKGTLYTPTTEEIKAILKTLKGKPKLFVLLSLNCGYTQQDLSDLRIDEVDLVKGTISRKRSKMESKEETTGKDSGQILQYKLFPETIELLKQFPPTDKVYYFTTDKLKQRLVQPAKKGRSDNTIHVWRYVKKHIGKTHTFGQLRRAVGKLLRYGADRQYHDLAPIFMGHVSDAVIDRNYAGQAEVVPTVLTDFIHKTLIA